MQLKCVSRWAAVRTMEIKWVNIKKMGKEMTRDNLTGDKVI